jgi:hypothetical protein
LLGGFDIVRDKGLIIFDDAWRYDPSRGTLKRCQDAEKVSGTFFTVFPPKSR